MTKLLFVVSLVLIPAAYVLADTGATPPKTEEVVTLSTEASHDLFERIRGAHLRAQQSGKLAVGSAATPVTH